MTMGHVPLAASLCVTTKSMSAVHPSLIEGLPVSASKADTEVTSVGAAEILQPSTVVGVILPLTTGTVLSSTCMVCRIVDSFKQASLMV